VQCEKTAFFARRFALVEIHPRHVRPLGDTFERDSFQHGPCLTAIAARRRHNGLRENFKSCRSGIQRASSDHADFTVRLLNYGGFPLRFFPIRQHRAGRDMPRFSQIIRIEHAVAHLSFRHQTDWKQHPARAQKGRVPLDEDPEFVLVEFGIG